MKLCNDVKLENHHINFYNIVELNDIPNKSNIYYPLFGPITK